MTRLGGGGLAAAAVVLLIVFCVPGVGVRFEEAYVPTSAAQSWPNEIRIDNTGAPSRIGNFVLWQYGGPFVLELGIDAADSVDCTIEDIAIDGLSGRIVLDRERSLERGDWLAVRPGDGGRVSAFRYRRDGIVLTKADASVLVEVAIRRTLPDGESRREKLTRSFTRTSSTEVVIDP